MMMASERGTLGKCQGRVKPGARFHQRDCIEEYVMAGIRRAQEKTRRPLRSRRLMEQAGVIEQLESRTFLSAAFDITGITALRNDANFTGIDGSDIGIAILDSGVFSTHPDLQPNFTAWYDAVNRTSSNSPFDPDGHGTHVSGTAAARNPEIGVATRARLIGVRALPGDGERRPRHDTVADALSWVLTNATRYNIRVVNMSLGVPTINLNAAASGFDTWENLIDQLEGVGVTVVSASGNSYGEFASPGASVPAVFSTLSVASTWEDNGQGDTFPFILGGSGQYYTVEREGRADRLAASSQRSTLGNQVAAPGQTILSSWNGSGGNLYQTIQGTSMASPLVAGMVALMQDAAQTYGGRYLTPNEVQSIVRSTADNVLDSNVTTNGRIRADTRQLENLPESGLTFKRVNVYQAIQRVREIVGNVGGGQPGEDQNASIANSLALPSVNGTRTFQIQGIIGSDGTIQVGQSDVDLYQVVLTSRGSIIATTSPVQGGSGNPDTFLRVFASSGVQIASDDDGGSGLFSRVVTNVLEPGTYYVGVSTRLNVNYNIQNGAQKQAGGSVGSYELAVSLDNPDPNGVVAGAVPFVGVPSFFPGSIGTDEGLTVGRGDVDFFQVIAPDDGVLTIDIDTEDYGDDRVDSYVRVFNANLQQLGANDDDGESTDSLLEISVSKGQVLYVSVTDFANRNFDPADPYNRNTSGTGGFYDLFLLFSNGDQNGTVFSAVSRNIGDTINGRIGADFGGPTIGADGSKDVDFFRYVPTTSGLLVAEVTGLGGFRAALSIWTYDSTDDEVSLLYESAEEAPLGALRVTAGTTYYIAVTGRGNTDFDWFGPGTGTGGETGDYTLATDLRSAGSANEFSDNSAAAGALGDISVGSVRAGVIGIDNGLIQGDSDIDVYRFVPQRTQTIVIKTQTTDEDSADTVLRLFASNGQELAFNDDASDDTTASIITFQVQAGQTYYIGVNGYSPDARDYNVLTGDGARAGKGGEYVLAISAEQEPEIEIRFGEVVINDGDTTPSTEDGTDYGSLDIDGERRTRTFAIFNTGDATLDIRGRRVIISGPNASDFERVKQARTSVDVGGSTTFRIRFDPSGAGVRTATITVLSDDADEGDYSFTITGLGIENPDINILGRNGIGIVSGDSTPDLADGSFYDSVRVDGARKTRTFTLENLGRIALNLTGSPRVLITGDAAGDFSVIKRPRVSVGVGENSTFRIRFDPSAAGVRSALVTIVSNDPNEGTYTFAISGVGV
jgi:subtilisin family serine protease